MKSVSGNVPVHFFTIHILVLQIFTGKYIVNYSPNFIHEKYFLGKDETQALFQLYTILLFIQCFCSNVIRISQISLLQLKFATFKQVSNLFL